MTNEFYDGAMENMSEQQFNMPMYQEEYYDYDEEEDFDDLAEDVFAEFEDYPNDRMYPERYVRPYPPYPVYPMYPMYPRYRYPYHRRPIYRRYPRYNMYHHPMPRRNY